MHGKHGHDLVSICHRSQRCSWDAWDDQIHSAGRVPSCPGVPEPWMVHSRAVATAPDRSRCGTDFGLEWQGLQGCVCAQVTAAGVDRSGAGGAGTGDQGGCLACGFARENERHGGCCGPVLLHRAASSCHCRLQTPTFQVKESPALFTAPEPVTARACPLPSMHRLCLCGRRSDLNPAT